MTVYKNYYTNNEENTPFCVGQDAVFYYDIEDAIDEIVNFDCNGSEIYHHTLAIEENGVCCTIDLQDEAQEQYQKGISESRSEREHQNSYSVEWRNGSY